MRRQRFERTQHCHVRTNPEKARSEAQKQKRLKKRLQKTKRKKTSKKKPDAKLWMPLAMSLAMGQLAPTALLFGEMIMLFFRHGPLHFET
jgi:hypothetical protein